MVSIQLVLACVAHLIYIEEGTKLLKARASKGASVSSDETTAVVNPFIQSCMVLVYSTCLVSASSCVEPIALRTIRVLFFS